MPSFKDHFSTQAAIYARYRPLYPPEMFGYLAGLTPQHELVWDCGTGNGQAATALAAHYHKVIATDPSPQQISHATPHPQVAYRVEAAEHSSLDTHSADLITIANALHWFRFDDFYAEARRVLKPGGTIAAWCYGTPSSVPEVTEIINHYDTVTIDPYWQYPNRLVSGAYRDLPFPFAGIATHTYTLQKEMDMDDIVGYLNTWSATQRYIADKGTNPTDNVRTQLSSIWGDPKSLKTITWRLVLKVGKV